MVGGVYRHETKYPISHFCDLSLTQVPACVFWFRYVLGSGDFVTIILCHTCKDQLSSDFLLQMKKLNKHIDKFKENSQS